MKTYTKKELTEILKLHLMWLNNQDSGVKANLSKADLSKANLSNADLRYANLRYANLRYADLSEANLSEANLSEANLSEANLSKADLSKADLSKADLSKANLSNADLSKADLRYADLRYADLSYANLSYANLINVKFNEVTSFYSLQCPAEGSFILWKKCKDKNDKRVIVKMFVYASAKRSSATTRKCRVSKVKVLQIFGSDKAYSITKDVPPIEYTVGKVIEVKNFNEDRWKECAEGVHGFITREEAENYNF